MKKETKISSVDIRQGLFYMVVGMILLGDFLVMFFSFPSQFSTLVNKWQVLGETTKEVATLSYISNVLAVQDKNTVSQYLTGAQNALPDRKKSAGFITGFTKFASTYGVAVKTLEFSPGLISTSSAVTGFLMTNASGEIDTFGNNVKAIPATLSVNAQASSLKIFLDALRKTSQLIDVTLVDYISSDKNNASANISLLIFYQPVSYSTVDWGKVRALSSDDVTFLGSLPKEDLFKLPTE